MVITKKKERKIFVQTPAIKTLITDICKPLNPGVYWRERNTKEKWNKEKECKLKKERQTDRKERINESKQERKRRIKY